MRKNIIKRDFIECIIIIIIIVIVIVIVIGEKRNFVEECLLEL